MNGSGSSAEQTYETVRVGEEAGIATIVLSRPEALNALNDQMKADLGSAIAWVAANDRVRVVILTAEGRAFCAGGDIGEMNPERPAHEHHTRTLTTIERVTLPLARLPKPVIAAVHGPAYGGGMSLALCCDIVVAAEDARFSLAFARVGLVPDMGALYVLPRVVGPHRAKEIAFTGDPVTATEAAAFGFVNRVVGSGTALACATEIAERLAQGPPLVYAVAKRMIDQSSRMSLDDIAQTEALAQAVAYSTPEQAAMVAAMRNRRTR